MHRARFLNVLSELTQSADSDRHFQLSTTQLLKLNFLTSNLNLFLNSLQSCPLNPVESKWKNFLTWNRQSVHGLEAVRISNVFSCELRLNTASKKYELVINIRSKLKLWSQVKILTFVHCCYMGMAVKHPVPDRVKPSFVIFDIRAIWRSGRVNVKFSSLTTCRHASTWLQCNNGFSGSPCLYVLYMLFGRWKMSTCTRSTMASLANGAMRLYQKSIWRGWLVRRNASWLRNWSNPSSSGTELRTCP